MCSGEDHGESERRMMHAASSSRNSASVLRSLSGSRRRALANTGRCGGFCVSATVFLSRRRRWLGMKLAGTVLTALWSRGRRRTLSAAYRRRRASWRAVSEFSSPAPGGRLGRPAARARKVTKNVRSPNERRRRMVPHVGIDLPSAPESCGPAGCALERWGRTLHTAPVSTKNCCLLSSSCKKTPFLPESKYELSISGLAQLVDEKSN